jgi:hypothetical protein
MRRSLSRSVFRSESQAALDRSPRVLSSEGAGVTSTAGERGQGDLDDGPGMPGRPDDPGGRGSDRWNPRTFEPPPDELLLAAVERAERHRTVRGELAGTGEVMGVRLSRIVDHLGFIHGSWTTRRLRPHLIALGDAGMLKYGRRHGIIVWELTGRGRNRVSRARRAGRVGDLPESPQHRAWREARGAAAVRIGEFHATVLRSADEVGRLLSEDSAHSDDWFELGEHLQRACRQLGSATHCLREWGEPDERRADIDSYIEPEDRCLPPGERNRRRSRRRGRRNVRNWDAAE